jgi:hypothetical protein
MCQSLKPFVLRQRYSNPCALLSTTPWGHIGVVEVQCHTFLTLVLDGGKRSALHPGRFTVGERDPHSPWLGGWVDPILDAAAGRKHPSPCREQNPCHPTHGLVTTLTELQQLHFVYLVSRQMYKRCSISKRKSTDCHTENQRIKQNRKFSPSWVHFKHL